MVFKIKPGAKDILEKKKEVTTKKITKEEEAKIALSSKKKVQVKEKVNVLNSARRDLTPVVKRHNHLL